jgi:aminopeptidase
MSALFRTAQGREYVPNMPTEEIFTTPDCRRAEGTIASSLPLALHGDIVKGLRLTVADGKIVDVEADHGAELVRGQLASDERAAYFGELALVDGTSRVGQTGITFFDTLYDENATCHIAYGFGVSEVFDGDPGEGMNVSTVHTDFMVGRPELEIDGLTADGKAVPILREETWQLPE